ncbi:NAD(P)-binding protein [Macroventuria anomochaeta]|uniref:NAD(P)-binding protein n=1 Tax=Macroventuria anomochaeta TaxID=301207 RepID=A0ACB6S5J0_9PLEO|nr:NAD(P)-binding protein [Macroventuria anomochaeta]KAF2629525.1 NAD(P)-binding protein [Macroventuria anomochaeta]
MAQLTCVLESKFDGLGAALAHHLAAKGANVVINYTSDAATAAATDLSQELEAQHLVRTLVAQFQIDILISNAGVINPAPMGSVTLLDFIATFDLNTARRFSCHRQRFRAFPNDRSGCFVNVSSIKTSMGFWWLSSYASTKGALEAMTRVWPCELGERCAVNSTNPGTMATSMYINLLNEMLEKVWLLNDMAPLAATRESVDSEQTIAAAKPMGGRPAYLEEVAGIVGLLCMPEAGWITG